MDLRAVTDKKYAEDVRSFFAYGLDYPSFDDEGWLVTLLTPSEVGTKPEDEKNWPKFYVVCDDLEETVARLRLRGVEFTREISETSFGRIASIKLPGGGEVGVAEQKSGKVYEPTS